MLLSSRSAVAARPSAVQEPIRRVGRASRLGRLAGREEAHPHETSLSARCRSDCSPRLRASGHRRHDRVPRCRDREESGAACVRDGVQERCGPHRSRARRVQARRGRATGRGSRRDASGRHVRREQRQAARQGAPGPLPRDGRRQARRAAVRVRRGERLRAPREERPQNRRVGRLGRPEARRRDRL